MQLRINVNNVVLINVLDPVERLTVEEFVHHPFLSEHAPERTIRYCFVCTTFAPRLLQRLGMCSILCIALAAEHHLT